MIRLIVKNISNGSSIVPSPRKESHLLKKNSSLDCKKVVDWIDIIRNIYNEYELDNVLVPKSNRKKWF